MSMERLAIYPGSFDPITLGHVDVIERAVRLFDRVEVAVGVNSGKTTMLSVDERIELILQSVASLTQVSVVSFDGLIADYAARRGAVALVRGVRQGADLEYEMRMNFANRRLNPQLDTVYLAASEEHTLISASIVREIHRWGGDVTSFVPPPVGRFLGGRANSN